MDLRQMRYVLAVVELGSVRAAARTLHVAQQSLSEQIGVVEREVGAALFRRSRSGMTVTAAGEAFAAHATVALDAAERVLAAARAAGGVNSTAPVRIAVATGLSSLAGDLIRRYLARHPNVDVRLIDRRTTEQLAALRDGDISAGIAYAPHDRRELNGLTAHQLRADRMHALLRRDDPLAGHLPVSIRQLAARPLLLPAERDASALRRQLLAVFDAHGVVPRLGTELHGYEMAFASVAAGRGYTLCVPAFITVDSELTFVPIAEDAPPLRVVLLTRRGDRHPAVADLTAVARTTSRARPA